MNRAVDDDLTIVDVPARRHYEARFGNEVVGFIEYRSVRGRRILFHTEVDRSVEGRGVGSRLVSGVLDDVRANGLAITVKCPFMAAFLQRHPEYRDLLSMSPAAAIPERSA